MIEEEQESLAQSWAIIGSISGSIFGALALLLAILAIPNPVYQLLGLLLFTFALFLVTFLFRKLRRVKRMIFRVLSDKVVLAVQEAEELRGRVKVFLDEKPVREAQMVVLRVWNSGNVPIKQGDYDNGFFEINFGEGAEVLEVDIQKTKSKSINSEIEKTLRWNSENIIIDPFRLDKRVAFTLKVLLTNYKGEINMDGTYIKGGQAINWDKTTFVRYCKAGLIYYPTLVFSSIISLFIALFIVRFCLYLFSILGITLGGDNEFIYLVLAILLFPILIILIADKAIKKFKPELLPLNLRSKLANQENAKPKGKEEAIHITNKQY